MIRAIMEIHFSVVAIFMWKRGDTVENQEGR
jgi:hypothetical protein